MTSMVERLNSWQAAADHHAPEYFWLALKVAPFVLTKLTHWSITRVRVIQTWITTANGNEFRVTYKRGPNFAGRRIEIRITATGALHYFGPGDLAGIKALLSPL